MKNKSACISLALIAAFLSQPMKAGYNNGQEGKKTEPVKTFRLAEGLTEKDYEPATIIFKLKPEYRSKARTNGVDVNVMTKALTELGANETGKIYPMIAPPAQQRNANGIELVDLSLIYQFTYTSGISVEKAANRILATGMVEYAEPRYTMFEFGASGEGDDKKNKTTVLPPFNPNDPDITGFPNNMYYISRIKCPDAWGINTTTARGDTNVVIGIVDSGCDWDHPDCMSQWKRNMGDPIDGIDNDLDGYVDNYRGWDISMNDNNPMNANSNHGSHVAGLAAAATNNGIGVASPGFNCKFLPVKCSKDASTTAIDNGYEGITYAANHGSKVINCSWGGGGGGSYGQDIIKYATINKDALVVVSAGNDNLQEKVNYPCFYDYAFCVANTTSTDSRATSTTIGNWVDISSPGQSVRSTLFNNTYGNLTGTSMASPICAGAAAIVRSFYPAYNALQAGEQLRVTADNHYSAPNNSGLVDKLGSGRVNLYRALTESKPSVRMQPINSTDNNDNTFVGNDTVRLYGVLTNFLAATTNLTVTVSTSNTNVTILNNTLNVGALATLGTFTVTPANAFQVLVKPTAPVNNKVSLKFTFQDGTYSAWQYYDVVVNVDYINIYINDVGSTNTSRGWQGWNGDVVSGLGFMYKDSSLLYEAGLMIGTSTGAVMDGVRGGTAGVNDADFTSAQVVLKRTSGLKSDFETYGRFTDNGATGEIGLSVRHNTYAWSAAGYRKFIIFEYSIKNTSGSTLNNLYSGIWADWDVSFATAGYNKGAVDVADRLGYVYSTVGSKMYAGTRVLTTSAPFVHYAIDNVAGGAGGIDINDGDYNSTADKFNTMSTNRAAAGATAGDVCNVVSSGPFTIANGDSVTVAFALLAGDNLTDIKTTGTKAQEKYDLLTSIKNILGKTTSGLGLQQNFPNPVNKDETVIVFSLGEKANAELAIYNAVGQKVMTVVNTTLPAGTHHYFVNVAELSDGIYYYQLNTGGNTGTMKMTIAR